MSEDADPAEAMLAELAGLDLTLARHVHACATTTEDPAEVAELVHAYHRVSRSLRQTLALLDRLKRARERDAKDTPPPPRDEVRIQRRKADLRTAVQRVIWSEREREEPDYLFELLEQRLEIHGRADDFAVHPLDDHILTYCAELDLPLDAAATWRDLPDPEFDDEDEDDAPPPEPLHQSSG